MFIFTERNKKREQIVPQNKKQRQKKNSEISTCLQANMKLVALPTTMQSKENVKFNQIYFQLRSKCEMK